MLLCHFLFLCSYRHAVINFHMKKLNCMHCHKIATMALELHGRNELFRYKNKMWKRAHEIMERMGT
jgi:hypothetical protein